MSGNGPAHCSKSTQLAQQLQIWGLNERCGICSKQEGYVRRVLRAGVRAEEGTTHGSHRVHEGVA